MRDRLGAVGRFRQTSQDARPAALPLSSRPPGRAAQCPAHRRPDPIVSNSHPLLSSPQGTSISAGSQNPHTRYTGQLSKPFSVRRTKPTHFIWRKALRRPRIFLRNIPRQNDLYAGYYNKCVGSYFRSNLKISSLGLHIMERVRYTLLIVGKVGALWDKRCCNPDFSGQNGAMRTIVL